MTNTDNKVEDQALQLSQPWPRPRHCDHPPSIVRHNNDQRICSELENLLQRVPDPLLPTFYELAMNNACLTITLRDHIISIMGSCPLCLHCQHQTIMPPIFFFFFTVTCPHCGWAPPDPFPALSKPNGNPISTFTVTTLPFLLLPSLPLSSPHHRPPPHACSATTLPMCLCVPCQPRQLQQPQSFFFFFFSPLRHSRLPLPRLQLVPCPRLAQPPPSHSSSLPLQLLPPPQTPRQNSPMPNHPTPLLPQSPPPSGHPTLTMTSMTTPPM